MINDEVDIYGDEKEIIKWLDNFLDNADDTIKLSADKFKGYYLRCINLLFGLEYNGENRPESNENSVEPQYSAIYLEDIKDFIDGCKFRHILKFLSENEDFMNEAVARNIISASAAERIKLYDKDKFDDISSKEAALLLNDDYNDSLDKESFKMNFSEDSENQMMVSLLKLHRYNNLQIKYAHTARVLYLAKIQTEELGIKSPLLRSCILTAALFHDLGRFYQGAYYNSYSEAPFKKIEKVDGVNSHAEAGYYYSLLDMSDLNVMGCSTDTDLIIHAIAAITVKKHGISNEKLGCYDRAIDNFSVNNSTKEQLLNFFLRCYCASKEFDDQYRGKFEPEFEVETRKIRSRFIQRTVVNLRANYLHDMNYEELYSIISDIFDYETDDMVLDDTEVIRLLTFENEKDNLPKSVILSPSYNKELRRDKLIKLLVDNGYEAESIMDFVEEVISDAENTQMFAQYDIVSVVDAVLNGEKINGIELTDDVVSSIVIPLAISADCDKIDILVQRATKRWEGWKPTGVKVKVLEKNNDTTSKESLIEILNNVFQFRIYSDEEKIVLTQPLVEQIQSCANSSKSFRKKLEDYNIDMSTLAENFVVDINNPLYKCLTESYPDSSIEVSYKVMAEVESDVKKRTSLLMGIVLPEDLRENVFKEDTDRSEVICSDGSKSKFPRDAAATEIQPHFIWGNAFPALWWHMDQFIMTNLRSITSFKYIKNSKLLEKIRGTYEDDCPEEFKAFINDIFEFTEEFIDVALSVKRDSFGNVIFSEEDVEGYDAVTFTDAKLMIEIRDETSRRYLEKRNKRNNDLANNELSDMFDDSNNSNADENDTGNKK